MKQLIIADQTAESTSQSAGRHISLGCVGAFQSAERAVVKRLTDTDQVVDQALNDQQSRK